MQSDLESLKEKATVYIAYYGQKFTVATASLKIGETIFNAEGISRQSHLDKPSTKVGAEVAAGRALKALCIKLKKGTEYPIRHKFMA
jgi:hypothetical protein